MKKEHFTETILADKEREWLIPFDDLDMDIEPYEKVTDQNLRKETIASKQEELVSWCKDIPGCNWSVGFIDDSDSQVMVVKWWFKDQE